MDEATDFDLRHAFRMLRHNREDSSAGRPLRPFDELLAVVRAELAAEGSAPARPRLQVVTPQNACTFDQPPKRRARLPALRLGGNVTRLTRPHRHAPSTGNNRNEPWCD
jgi:hypothetical protein